MHFPRYTLGALLSAGIAVLACSDNDTVLALNIAANSDSVGHVSLLKVRISQSGQTPIDIQITPASQDAEAGKGGAREIVGQTDYRVTLPDGWDGEAEVRVVTIDESGNEDLTATATVDIVKEEATAAFVDLKREEPAPPMGGAGGAGGGAGGATGGTGTQAGSGGAETGGAPAAGSGGVSAGAGGSESGGSGGSGGG